MIQTLLFGSGGEHCDLELAAEVRRRKEEEGGGRRRKEEEGGGRRREEEGGGQADIKSNNPHLTNGEINHVPFIVSPSSGFTIGKISQITLNKPK